MATAKPAKAKKAAQKQSATTAEERTIKPHEIALSPTIQNAVGVHAWSKFAGEADLGELVADLRDQVKRNIRALRGRGPSDGLTFSGRVPEEDSNLVLGGAYPVRPLLRGTT